MFKASPKLFILIIFSLFILVVTLYFGLRFNGFRFTNNASLLKNEPGILFKKNAIAYLKIGSEPEKVNIPETGSFAFELAFKPRDLNPQGFSILFSIHNGSDEDQLIVGQWKSHIIIMNGDDYSYKRKIKRISFDLNSTNSGKTFLTVTSGQEGTSLYLQKKFIKKITDFSLKIPKGEKRVLTFGNSVYGKSPWEGELYGFALYGLKNVNDEIYGQGEEKSGYEAFSGRTPILKFDFADNKTDKSGNLLTGKDELVVPHYFTILKKQVLILPWKNLSMNKVVVIDIILNLLGFIPLGYILSLLLINLGFRGTGKTILITILICFSISLFIEITQAWIVSRTSQSLDLILNTLSGFLGGLVPLGRYKTPK